MASAAVVGRQEREGRKSQGLQGNGNAREEDKLEGVAHQEKDSPADPEPAGQASGTVEQETQQHAESAIIGAQQLAQEAAACGGGIPE